MKSVVLALSLFLLLPTLAHSAGGAATYAAKCASCHGADGSADTPVGKAMKIPSLKGSDAGTDDIVAAIGAHKTKIDVSDEDAKAVAGFVEDL